MEVTICRYTTGINNKVDPARIPYDPETGVTGLENCTDMLIDIAGGMSTRRGSDLVESGDFHSGYFLADGSFYAVKNRTTDSALYKVDPQPDGTVSVTGIRSGLTIGALMSYRLVDGKIYYMNGYERGVLSGDASDLWPTSIWPDEDTADNFVDAPIGSHVDMLSGRFLIAVGKELQYTEAGFYGLMDGAINYRVFESEIILIVAVDTGVYVSDEKAVYFLDGRNPEEWILLKVLDYPAIPYCRNQELVDPSQYGLESTRPSALFGTVNGLVIGLPDGTPFNLIDKKVVMTSGYSHGSIMVVDETTIIQSGA